MSEVIYYALHVVGILASCGYVWCLSPKYHVDRKRFVFCVALSYIASYAWMLGLYWIITGMFGGQNVVRVIVFFPLIVLFWSYIFKIPPQAALDLTAPIPCIAQAFGKIGCQIVGCCSSWWEVDWGIYNPLLRKNLFPIQLTEGLVSLGIAVLLVGCSWKKKEKTGGWLMPWSLVLFGVTRFFLEYLRNNEKVFCNISELALWSALMSLEGGIWLCIKYYRNRSVRKVSA